MRFVWTLLKVVVGLAVAIAVAILVLAMGLGILGALVGLAVLALKLAFFALVGVGLFKLASHLCGARPGSRSESRALDALPAPDPHYEAAMRELDRELGEVPDR